VSASEVQSVHQLLQLVGKFQQLRSYSGAAPFCIERKIATPGVASESFLFFNGRQVKSNYMRIDHQYDVICDIIDPCRKNSDKNAKTDQSMQNIPTTFI
jgi:hypothetical protein